MRSYVHRLKTERYGQGNTRVSLKAITNFQYCDLPCSWSSRCLPGRTRNVSKAIARNYRSRRILCFTAQLAVEGEHLSRKINELPRRIYGVVGIILIRMVNRKRPVVYGPNLRRFIYVAVCSFPFSHQSHAAVNLI